MGMSWLHGNRFRKVSSAFLVLFFFGSQAFSCCLVDRRMGDWLEAGLAALAPESVPTETQACCPSKQGRTAKAPQGHPDRAESTGCCILDAKSKAPQIGSEGLIQPSFPVLVLERLRPLAAEPTGAGPVPTPRIALSHPPLFLTNLQLLI